MAAIVHNPIIRIETWSIVMLFGLVLAVSGIILYATYQHQVRVTTEIVQPRLIPVPDPAREIQNE